MSKKRWALGCGVVVPLVCCCGGGLVFQILVGPSASKQKDEIAAARRAGIPLEPQELNALAKVPDSQNAAPLYQELTRATKGNPAFKKASDLARKRLGSKATAAERQAIPGALRDLAPIMAKIGRAADMPGCDFHRDWSRGASLLFPELALMRTYAQLLCADALVRSDRGDWRGALKSIQRAENMSRHAGGDPIIIGMLIQVAVEAIAIRALNEIIQSHGRDSSFVAEATKTIQSFRGLPDLRRSLMGEVVMGRATIRTLKGRSDFDFDSEQGPKEPSVMERAFFQSQTVQSALDAKFIEAYRRMIERMPRDPAQWETATQVAREEGDRVAADRSITNSLNQILFPVLDEAPQTIGQALMRRRMTETSLRLLAERNRTGAFPRRLPDYGDVRIDPFTGKPFHYLHEGNGVMFYSVGRDRTDEGGTPRDPNDGRKPFDEPIHLK